MAIVTISRQMGSFGDEIAEAVAEQLGYLLIEKSRLYEMASDLKGDYSKEIEVLSKESKPGFFDALFSQRVAYFHLMAAMIYEFAGQNNIVVKGRGGQFLLRDVPFVVNCRVKAPFDLRVKRVAESQSLDQEMVRSLVKKSDNSCEDFNRYLYKKNVADAMWYDVVFDTFKLSQETITAFLVQEAKRIEQQSPMSKEDRERYNLLGLEKRIEMALMKEMADSNYIKIKALPGKNVIISGYLSTELENSTAERIVSAIKGVESVENNIVVSQYPVKLWH